VANVVWLVGGDSFGIRVKEPRMVPVLKYRRNAPWRFPVAIRVNLSYCTPPPNALRQDTGPYWVPRSAAGVAAVEPDGI
jgi:hypothetical protein